MKCEPKTIFVSQQGQELHPESGCGVASFLMLLKYINFKPLPSWNNLCGELRLDLPPIEKGYSKNDPEIGLYPEDIFRFVVKENLLFRMHFFDNEWQESLDNGPIMVLLHGVLNEFPDESHWVVLTSFDGQIFSYLDPWSKDDEEITKMISFAEFKKYYTGVACQLLMSQQVDSQLVDEKE
ncbi:C39 family peptidase [Candidatus Berkiella aquae]|uniref:Peptidase C39-like domain-containing protein n=1 Tax=Candidatus Berkiella aquae TaxID=295108 RepID=A0AAE3L8S9_9GAMM|nr:C39 family peptidase [Candidatus Berkiella aquae]MCS5712847.1 hypothetical protein [Candidatus Berkiella aquae]